MDNGQRDLFPVGSADADGAIVRCSEPEKTMQRSRFRDVRGGGETCGRRLMERSTELAGRGIPLRPVA